MTDDLRPPELELSYDEFSDWPLWFEGGQDEQWASDVLGLSEQLIGDLGSWQRACDVLYVTDAHVPVGGFEWSRRRQVLLDRGTALAGRLRSELPGTAVHYRPPPDHRIDADDSGEAPRPPTAVRLMWDHCVTWPLWGPLGNLRDDPAYVRDQLRLSDALAADLRAWALAAEDHQVLDPPQDDASERRRKRSLDRWARDLVRRLRRQLPPDVPVRYHP